MKKAIKTTVKVFAAVLCLVILLSMTVFVYHRIMLAKEKSLIDKPLGQMLEVDGNRMCVYSEGEGEHTLVFMSGWGTPSPTLDFKCLYSLLSDEYRIVVVEKFGYGFSDTVDTERSFDTILRQDREALEKAGINGPYILCPHSLSGLEAILWAQKFPDEVEAIVSLDMTLPNVGDIIDVTDKAAYREVRQYKLLRFLGLDIGFIRIPFIRDKFIDDDEALSDEDNAIYSALICEKALNDTMLNEYLEIPKVIEEIKDAPKPDIPMLMFLSTLTPWENVPNDYASDLTDARLIWLDCGHYLYHYEPERISVEIRAFTESLDYKEHSA